MHTLDASERKKLEGRSLVIGMWGNLFMGGAGVMAAILSNSNAILVDGLFSLIGFTAALLGRNVSRNVDAGPDRLRPIGYAADEAIFTTFRALSLLGLLLFAMCSAVMNIYNYATGHPPEPLIFEPLIVYFIVIGLTCFLLWWVHHRSWSKTGRNSDVLRLEAKAAAFDGVITAAAGLGILGILLLQDTALGVITPVGDSIIVLLLCLTAVTQYYKDFMSGLGELAGVTAGPEHIAKVRRAIRKILSKDGGRLVDLSILKLGRSFHVSIYYDPMRALDAQEFDKLTLDLEHELVTVMPLVEVVVLPTQYGRRWPDDVNPRKNPRTHQ
ncbi:cation transporter [Ruegeria litorea]|uniref:Cation transporter n=1 Tax=Falsiruegeria litorea TaxID=1280831 RepID=A0ABS5WML9_9RHOB|nr:cation transporter [Falsiruegeria litorea]MBT3140375.1 cation transporter [Falsiruegeria litorea]